MCIDLQMYSAFTYKLLELLKLFCFYTHTIDGAMVEGSRRSHSHLFSNDLGSDLLFILNSVGQPICLAY